MLLAAGGAVLFSASVLLAGVTRSPHDFSQTGPYSRTLGKGGVCSPCHVPHNALDNVLWPRSLSGYKNHIELDKWDGNPSSERNFLHNSTDSFRAATVQCYDCHDYHDTNAFETPYSIPRLGTGLDFYDDLHYPQNILSGFRKNTPNSGPTMNEDGFGKNSTYKKPGYFENSPPADTTFGVSTGTPIAETGGHFFKTDPTDGTSDSLKAGDKLACNLCHDPHAWNPIGDWQAFIRRNWPGSANPIKSFLGTSVIASTEMANQATRFDGSSPDNVSRGTGRNLCIACHGTSDNRDPVKFSDIGGAGYSDNLILQKPEIPGNERIPATIGDHGSGSTTACTTCHSHNAIAANCTQCHGFPPAPYPSDRRANLPMASPLPVFTYSSSRDPHPRHYGKYDNGATASIYAYGCTVCHATSALGSRSASGVHGNNNLNIAYDFSALGVPNPPDNVSTGRFTCTNVYCHSFGATDNTIPGYFRTAQWGVTTVPLNCNACHGDPLYNSDPLRYGMPDYAGGAPGSASANSHPKHVVSGRYECSVCHVNTVNPGDNGLNRSIRGTTPTLHVDGSRQVGFDGVTAIPRSGNGYDAGTKSCNVNCHSSVTLPQWGGTLSCDGCHQSQGAGTGVPATYTAVHQRHTDNTAYGFACEQCHALNSTRGNTAHLGGDDNTSSGRYVEVRFTDNASSAWSYDNTAWTFRSVDAWTPRYGLGGPLTPTYADNAGIAGTDAVRSDITWSAGSCGAVWCHSNANPAQAGAGTGGNNIYRAPAWATPATPRCTLCHLGPDGYDNMVATVTVPANGGMSHGHQVHVATDRYRFSCDECHAGTAAADTTTAILSPGGYAKHVDGAKDVKGGTGVRLSPINDNSLTYTGSRTCTTTYCHSAGVDNDAAGGFDNAVESPAWGSGATHCTSCHGGTIASGTPISTGKHLEHLQEGYRCSNCHSLTIAADSDNVIRTTPDGNGKTGYDYHVNGVKDYVAGDGFSFTQGSCNNISCHGGTGATWTGPSIGCTTCHLHNAADNDFYLSGTDNLYTAQHPPNIDNTEWVHSGHGRASGNYDVSNFPAANFPGGVGGSGDQCNYCHDDTVTHNTALNPFRLKSQTGVTGYGGAGWNATCLVCHSRAPVPPGYDPDGSGTPYSSRVAQQSFADSAHFGTEHGAGNNGGKFCWDCHDPHGDRKSGGPGNIYMVQKGRLARQTDNTYGILGSAGALTTNAPVFTGVASGTSYADNTTYLGICQVCHTQGTTGHYRSNFGDGHNASTRCTQCHKHDTGFAPSDCKGCHGGSGGDNQVGAAGAPLITRYWKTSGHGSDNATARFGRQIECEDCHDLNIQSGEGTHEANDSTGTAPNNINTEDWPNKAPRTGNTNPNVNTSHLVPAYIGSGTDAAKAGTFDDACYNRCHAGESVTDHRHTKSAQKDMLFGRHKTTLNPKQYNWYSQSTYSFDFYRSWSPWVIQDTTTAGFPYSAPYYGTCVSCHDPHGTGVSDNTRLIYQPSRRTNHMVRGDWISNADVFCNTACHRQP